MKAVAPYVISAALLLPPSSATIGAASEALPGTQIFYYANSGTIAHVASGLSTFSTTPALSVPELTAEFSPVYAFSNDAEPYEPFIAAEAWREIPAPEAPVKIVFEGRPASFFDAHDLAAIAVYE